MINLKRSAKFLSLILAVILVFTPLIAINAAAVNYPQGITKEQTLSVIPKLNSVAKVLLSSGSQDISSGLYDTLYDDKTVNTLFAEIYKALGENADALSIVGVNISPAALSVHLNSYEDISKKIASCQDLSAVIKASDNFRWGINSKKSFENAIAAMMSPFNELLNALMCSGTVEINSLLSIKGDDGYTNAVVPILKAMDCPRIMSSADFSAAAAKNYRNIIRNVIDMLFLSIDNLLENPVTGLCETLPKIAYFIKSGKLSESVNALLEPLSVKVAGFLTIPGVSELISGLADLEGSFNIEDMMGELDISSLLGSDVKLSIPEIDFQALADCVTDNGSSLTADKADAFIVVMNFLLDTIKMNSANMGELLGDEAISDMLTPFLSKSNDEIITAIVTLFSMTSLPQNTNQWAYPSVAPSSFTYTPNLTEKEYTEFLGNADSLLTDFVKETDPEGNIEDTLRKTIYSNSLISTLLKEVFSMLAGEDMAPMLAIMGLDVSPAGIANAVYSYVPATANYLYNFYTWTNVNPEYLNWGFEDGDSEGFKTALTKILSPMIPLLSCLLAGENITVMDALTIPGADGYNTAMIPLLEAIGCKADTIKTYEEYKKGAGTEAVLTDLFIPLGSLIDEICASPINTLCRILPNIIYFFDSGLMNSFILNLLYPIDAMLTSAGLDGMLDGIMNQMPQTDLNETVGSLVSGIDLGIVLPELNISKLGTLGTLKTMNSKRVYNGSFATYSYLEADAPAVFLTIMRYVTGAISMEENSGLLTGLMGTPEGGEGGEGGEAGTPDMFAMFAENIAAKFEGMTSEEMTEWLCDLLFSSSPIKELPVEKGEPPTIIYKEKFELSTTAKIIIVVAVIAVLALVYYILSVSGKLDKFKLSRQKKKDRKERQKEAEKLRRAGGIPEDKEDKPQAPLPPASEEATALSGTESVSEDSEASSKEAVNENGASDEYSEYTEKENIAEPEIKATPSESKPLTEEMKAELLDKLNDEPERNVVPSSDAKLDRRQQSAMKKAYKNQLKAQKIYEKAAKQAAKKK